MFVSTLFVVSTVFCTAAAHNWTNAIIPLDIDNALDELALRDLKIAVAYFEAHTCVRFPIGNESTIEPRLPVTDDCCGVSYGDGGKKLYLNVNYGHNTGPSWRTKSMFHEFLHAQGLEHTHQRPDNALYINRRESEVKETYPHDRIDRRGIPYEYGSGTHYSSRIPWDPKYESSPMGKYPSFYNILWVNSYFKCFERCANAPKLVCKNGGVMDVNNCSKCFCPRQYAGDFCEERSPGNAPLDCGKTIKVTDQVQSVEMTVQEKPIEKANEPGWTHCYYRLEAPSCKRIQVTIRNIPDYVYENCLDYGLEIFANIDKRQTGYRYCLRKRVNETIISEQNTLMLDAFNWNNNFTFKIDVSAVD